MNSRRLVENLILESLSNWAILHTETSSGEVISASSAKHALIKSFNNGFLSERPWRDEDEEDPYLSSGLDRKDLYLVAAGKPEEMYVKKFGGRSGYSNKHRGIPEWDHQNKVQLLKNVHDTILVYSTTQSIGDFQS